MNRLIALFDGVHCYDLAAWYREERGDPNYLIDAMKLAKLCPTLAAIGLKDTAFAREDLIVTELVYVLPVAVNVRSEDAQIVRSRKEFLATISSYGFRTNTPIVDFEGGAIRRQDRPDGVRTPRISGVCASALVRELVVIGEKRPCEFVLVLSGNNEIIPGLQHVRYAGIPVVVSANHKRCAPILLWKINKFRTGSVPNLTNWTDEIRMEKTLIELHCEEENHQGATRTFTVRHRPPSNQAVICPECRDRKKLDAKKRRHEVIRERAERMAGVDQDMVPRGYRLGVIVKVEPDHRTAYLQDKDLTTFYATEEALRNIRFEELCINELVAFQRTKEQVVTRTGEKKNGVKTLKRLRVKC